MKTRNTMRIAAAAVMTAAVVHTSVGLTARPAQAGDEPRPVIKDARVKDAVQPKLKVRPELVRPLPLPPRPDPAAHRLSYEVVSRTSQFAGRVRITGIVKNVGRDGFASRPRQQEIHLYEDSRLVARKAFTNLGVSEEVKISYDRMWNSSSPAEGEFPPTYKLVIVYDPDIRLDGNPKNDDFRSSNNKLERTGAGINSLF